MDKPITNFRNEYRFLSNFYRSWFTTPKGVQCPTVEHAFQACKTDDPAERLNILRADTPLQARHIGRHVNLRSNWNAVRVSYMRQLVYMKFKQSKEMTFDLLATGDAHIAEGNHWGDKFWGVDSKTGEGQNHLGKILMEVRDVLRAEKVVFGG